MENKKIYARPTIEIAEIEDVITTSVTVTEWDGNNIDALPF